MEEKFIYEYQSLSMKIRHSIPRDLEWERATYPDTYFYIYIYAPPAFERVFIEKFLREPSIGYV
jgi:hypothetical protein